METTDIIQFFDKCAKSWDDEMVRSDRIIGEILDRGGVTEGKDVLDVACGTGVLFPDYLGRNVASVTGVDISSEMAKIAESKFADEKKVQVICSDVCDLHFDKKYDCIMIYNAFPHFPEPENLFTYLSTCLKDGGRITVAHGMSRERIDAHHRYHHASKVSLGLMHEEQLVELMGKWFVVDTVISDNEKYIVSGVK